MMGFIRVLSAFICAVKALPDVTSVLPVIEPYTLTDNPTFEETSGCACTNDTRELSCNCGGPSVIEIPKNLTEGVTKLSVIRAPIEELKADSFIPYRNSLRDLYLESLKKLHYIYPETFSNITNLRTIYIHQSPKLHQIADGVLYGNFPNLKLLKIIHSGLEMIPAMNQLHADTISSIDFNSNRIRNLTSGAVQIKAEIMNLDYNMIELIQNLAFHGSEIARLSLKGNKALKVIEERAFMGLQNLRKLDLSDTRISRLPTTGLDNLEVLKLTNTFTLKVFPSVYHFKFIKEAYLTYPYHCCAFKFPATHDPEEFAKFKTLKADMERIHCSIPSTAITAADEPPNTTTESFGFESLFSMVARRFSFRPLTLVRRETARDDFGKFIYNAYDKEENLSTVWNGLDEIKHVQTGFGVIKDPQERNFKEFEGTFHVTTVAVRPELPVKAFCGDFAKNYRDVKCYPAPDAFNPCEDVMGNIGLRVAVWFVVVAAVLGNLAVMIVLMSSRFTMSVSKFLMCNLAFADLCMGIYLLIIAAVDAHTIGVYFNSAIDWQHGTGCKVAGFITVFASELSIFTLTVITLERLYAITYAIHLNKRLKLGLAAKIMIVGWLYAVTMATLPILGISGYTKTSICLPVENNDSTDLAFLITLLSINGLAFLLICGCYAKMYISIIRQQSRATANDKTVAKRMAMLVFTDFACWAPIAFFGITAVAGYPLINVTNSKILLVFFYPLNSCANPFLYAILTKQYRRDFFILISRYGFCSKRAMKYKGTYSCNTTHRVLSLRTNYRSSLFTQVSFENGRNGKVAAASSAANRYDDGARTDSDTTYEIVRLGSERRQRRLSIVCEDRLSSDDERSSSPLHKGSPHPIKNSYTKLNFPNNEQEEILQRVLGEGRISDESASPSRQRDTPQSVWSLNASSPLKSISYIKSEVDI